MSNLQHQINGLIQLMESKDKAATSEDVAVEQE